MTDPATEISLNEAREMYRPLYGDEVANSIELGDEMEFPKPTEVLGRIAAQTAKQVIFQKVREAERENIFAEYNQRIGEVVNGTVKRFENGDIILEIGRIEAVLPRKEQSRAESYTPGDRVRTVIKGVNRSAKGPQIVLSRTDPALLIKLFEQEVPEIYDGTVMIRGAVREAGDRAKVAVFSRERDVDPVGACVGMKGTRVQSIIRELRGEKIDIVEWSEDPIAFVTNALSPAKVQRVSIVDDRERVMEVDRRGQAAVARDRQEGPERPARGEADRLADRHQERGGKAARGRSAVRRARSDGEAATRSGAEDARRSPPRKAAESGGRAGASRARRARSSRCRHRPDKRRKPTAASAERGGSEATPEPCRSCRGSARRPPRRSWQRTARSPPRRRGEVNRGNSLATVRIYKVAELLGTTSQEVTALLKRDHGIEVKSASSTIEEVVARQFVERLARQRNISLPSGDMFAETPVAEGQEGRAREEAGGAGEAGAPVVAAAATGQDGQAGRCRAGARTASLEEPPPPVEPPPAEPVFDEARRLRRPWLPLGAGARAGTGRTAARGADARSRTAGTARRRAGGGARPPRSAHASA